MTNDTFIALKLPKKLKQQVKRLAEEQDRSTSYVVRDILIDHLQRLQIERAIAAKQAAPEPAAA